MRYEYVASGINFAVNHTKDQDPSILYKKINGWIDKINCTHDHYVSSLFNAYTEADDGEDYKKYFTSFENLMSDSGGLQMVSLGHGSISDAAKEKIYDVQAKYSDIAMIFDEVPVTVPDSIKAISSVSQGPKKRLMELKNTESRVFDPAMFNDCAKETARNIKNQIEYFDKVGSDTKILCILQGNSTEWYQKWLDIILKEIPSSEHKRLGGIAFGSPAFGAGLLEDIEKYFFISQIEGPEHLLKHFHLLGVGAINRLYPVAIFRNSGLIPNDVLISYDSTKHTGGLVRGDLQIEHECVRAERSTQRNLSKQSSAIISFAEHILKSPIADRKFLHDAILHSKSTLQKMYGDSPELNLKLTEVKFLILMTSIYNFIKTFDKCHRDEEYLNKVCNNPTILALKNVGTQKEFDEWKIHAKSSISSNKVKSINSNPLMELF